MVKSYSIHVIGRVQGVFFRASTKEAAIKYNIHGFVRNEFDSSVYIEAEGEENNLEKFIDWCKEGPELAKVEEVKIEEEPIKNFSDFIISH
ncbi:MAG: acylphosphatase [Bacteroidia bacterium]|nr:acylphosphatase [Bacteroidia bacterium]